MAGTIHILPEHLANKIAAGEVVQRPDSVVKELIENSLDAGADEILVAIKDGGKSLIQISDNGTGIAEDDVHLAFARYATSKIGSYEDLESLRTYGFRGEALASIAAVAQVEFKTRREEDAVGTLVRIDGGEIKEQSPASLHRGTIIAVKNLFYNTPARRHFLKSMNTEFKHIYETIQRVALSHPEVALQFVSNEEILLDLKPSNVEQRLIDVYGEPHAESLVAINGESPYVSIKGFVGKPNFARKSKPDQHIFLNGRFIISRMIHHAVLSGYEHLLEKGSYPFYLLFLDIDPAHVDVNVHPSKLEVKFSDEQSIYRLAMSCVRRAVGMSDQPPDVRFEHELPPEYARLTHSKFPSFPFAPVSPPSLEQGETLQSSEFSQITIERIEQSPADHQERDRSRKEFDENFESNRFWQLHHKYILMSTEYGVMIIDQHVAHERILYERTLHLLEGDTRSTQHLLFPITLSLTAGEMVLIIELQNDLKTIGFDLKEFGKNTVVLEGIPSYIPIGCESTILQDILREYQYNQQRIALEPRDNIAKSFACKAAIKAGAPLTEAEMRGLVRDLFKTSMPYVCPHGRPVAIQIPLNELDRRFMRTS